MRAEDPAQRRAGATTKAGDTAGRANLRGEVALKEERIAEAARFFQQGQDYLRAAELFESIGHAGRGRRRLRGGRELGRGRQRLHPRRAQGPRGRELRARRRPRDGGASSTRRSGQGGKAIELYEKAGLHLQERRGGGARRRPRQGDRPAAARGGRTTRTTRAATELLAQLFIEAGMPALAVERVQKALGGQPVSAANLDLYYWLARRPEAAGNARRGAGHLQEDPGRGPAVPDVGTRGAPGEGGSVPPLPPPRCSAPSAAARRAPAARRRAASPAAPPAGGGSGGRTRPRFVAKEEIGRGPLGVVLPRRGPDRRPQRRAARAAARAAGADGRAAGVAGRPEGGRAASRTPTWSRSSASSSSRASAAS